MVDKTAPAKILFITPFFERTGSEVLLLNILKNIDVRLIQPYLFSLRAGELIDELPASIPYYLPYNTRKSRKEKYIKSILKRLKINPLTYRLKQIQRKINADIWYLNTILLDPSILKLAKELEIKVITHFHELPNFYRHLSSGHLQTVIEHSDVCIGCSEIVCEKIKDLGHQNIKLLYSFIDTRIIDRITPTEADSISLRKELNIASDEFIWVISGSVTYEKGLDYIPQILKELQNERTRIIWLGKVNEDGLTHYIFTYIEKNFPNKALFIGGLDHTVYYDYLHIANGLLIPSKQDSFPLVMLEAAYLGLPIVSFNSGGVNEFVTDEKGIVVDSWSVPDLANAMKNIMHSQKAAKDNRVSDHSCSVENQMRRFHHLVAEILKEENYSKHQN